MQILIQYAIEARLLIDRDIILGHIDHRLRIGNGRSWRNHLPRAVDNCCGSRNSKRSQALSSVK